jgi:hypothetical protein
MPAAEPILADDAPAAVRLSLPVCAGAFVSEVRLETAHSERLLRTAAYRAIRDGRLAPGAPVWARLAAGAVRARHGSVDCLDGCRVHLLDAAGAEIAATEFPRRVFAAQAVARALHVVSAAGAEGQAVEVSYALHAEAVDEAPFPVALPALESLSVDALAAESRHEDAGGFRDEAPDDWIASFTTAAFDAGLDRIEERSRASGLEAAGHVHARVGFDPRRRRFVRILDRVVISDRARASALAVVSTAASWGEFLAGAAAAGPRAPSSVHTHLHLAAGEAEAGAGPGSGAPARGDGATLSSARDPVISNDDLVSHYDSYPDPLSAALVVSLFPAGRLVKRYGYTRDGVLAEERGGFALTADLGGAGARGGDAWR